MVPTGRELSQKRLVGFRAAGQCTAVEPEHAATSVPVKDAGGLLFFAVVSHRNEDDGLTVSQGRIVNSQRFSLECPTALQPPQHTHPKALFNALKVK